MAIDSGGYLCTNKFRSINAAWVSAPLAAEVGMMFDLTGLSGSTVTCLGDSVLNDIAAKTHLTRISP